MTRAHAIAASLVLALTLMNCFAQVLKGSREPEGKAGETSINWGDKNLAEQLARNVKAGPKIALPKSGQNSNSAALALLKQQRQSAAAAASPNKPGVSGVEASPQTKTALPTSSVGSLGTSKTDAATGRSGTQAVQVGTKSSGPISAQARQAQPPIPCMRAEISDVDGAPTGIVFSPGYSYVIHGCGFGNQPGAVYLMGVKQETAPPQGFNVPPPALHSDWVTLGVPGVGKHQTQNTWTNTRIEVVVDPNTSGFYDSSAATVVVILSDNITQLQAHGFTFFAARAQQTLASLPRTLYGASSPRQLGVVRAGAGFSPAHVTDGAGHAVQANLLSPSAASLVLPGHTFAVVREDNASAFSAGTDTVDMTNGLQTGFEVSSIQLFYAALTQAMCPGSFSANGNWNAVRLGGPDRLSVTWQEQSCGGNGVSAYALDVFVEGPRGVSAI
jgi:hypothetical protein